MKLRQTTIEKILALAFFAAGVLLFLSGCTKVDAPSLYDQNYKGSPQPIVDSLSPAGSALAGIDTITIYGKNFSADKANDGIYFNATLLYNTSIISASPTKLVVKAPAISGDTIQVRVYVVGAENFSPTITYKLIAAVSPFSKLASGESAYGLCIGPDDSLYASLFNANLSVKDEGIFKITSDGTINRTAYVLPTTSPINSYWGSIKFGPDGNIYALNGKRIVYQLVPGATNPGGATAHWISSFSPAATSFNDLDFDANNNLWVGGNNQAIYRVNINDKSTKSFPFVGNVRAMRCFNGYLYFAATVSGANKVFRAPIVGDSLGNIETYFDISTAYTGTPPNILAITFSAEGDMYVGTDAADFLIIVGSNGSVERPYPLYVSSGVLTSACKSFAWVGTTLYASTSGGGLLKIAPQKQGSTNYGLH